MIGRWLISLVGYKNLIRGWVDHLLMASLAMTEMEADC
jgi:hypothetical protein